MESENRNIDRNMKYMLLSLSTVVLNSRDW